MLPLWHLIEGNGPLLAAAVHSGHALRPDVAAHIALSDDERRREEDPFTGHWTEVADTRLVGQRSRFEVDLNRPRDEAVYREPDDAWGLEVWKNGLPESVAQRSLEEYDAFYAEAYRVLKAMEERHGRFVVFDIHSYNHRREGPGAPPDDPAANPEINVGTGTMDRARWASLVDRFIDDLRAFDYPGRGPLDVRENVRFQGGYFPRWVHETFPETGCALAIEVKKFYMDEWTGEPYPEHIAAVREAMAATVPGVLSCVERLPV